MIKMPFFKATMFALIAAFIITPACEKPLTEGPGGVLSNEKTFDIDLFQDNIEAGLGNQWAGYAYVISRQGNFQRSGAFGKRVAGNDGDANFLATSPIYGASINKVMTAVAMLKILEEQGNGDAAFWLNANVAQFLPPNWSFGPNTPNISFRNLLQHRSGIAANAPIDYAGLRTMIAGGTSANKGYVYSNANYALLRILIARMSGNAGALNADDTVNSNATLSGFRKYMETEIFEPLGISVNTRPFGSNPALYYQWGNLNNGWNIGDMTNRLGNGGFYFSPTDASKFLSYLNHSEEIISKETREAMYNQFLGWSDGGQPGNEPEGDYGVYYYKGGSFCNSTDGNGNCLGQGVRNIVATFPHNGVEVVVMGNSRGGNMDNSATLRAMLRNAYDNAWVKN